MKKQRLHIILLPLLLFIACSDDHYYFEEDIYIELHTRAGEDAGSDMPCFIFWRSQDLVSPYMPYIYSIPAGSISSYTNVKYNTEHIYPPIEPIHAMGVSPSSIMPQEVTDISNWEVISISKTSNLGLVDIQCASKISANEQNPFNTPLIFEHKLAKLEFKVYCGESMWKDATQYINVTDISVTVTSGNGQWVLFPKELTLDLPLAPTQYIVNGYAVGDTDPEVSVAISHTGIPGNTKPANAELIGNFYFMPGFNDITITLKATYIDHTGTNGNGNQVVRVWNDMSVENIAGIAVNDATVAGKSYTINIGFEAAKIILGAKLEEWSKDQYN